MRLKLPIGLDDFARIIEDQYTYVDKTLLVEEVLQDSASVQLITRPRRFGKTLNMSMLSHFFDHRANSRDLFRGLAIEQRPCFDQQGQFPVLFLSFKDLKASSYTLFLGLFRNTMSRLYRRHDYLLKDLGPLDTDTFMDIARGNGDEADLMEALFQLMEMLHQHHGKKVVLLIDEYDSPIHEAYSAGYYEEMITFMRGALGRLLKSNASLHKAVLTGILRVAKESIFSDLNNIQVYSLLDKVFADKFGFTETETQALLEEAGLGDEMGAVGDWYNGYRIGGSIIYNPWSLISFLKTPDEGCRPYWVNTSANLLVREQLLHASLEAQNALKSLLNGESVTTLVNDQTVFRDIQRDDGTLWSFLLFSGYLTVRDTWLVDERRHYALAVPNKEVLQLFQDIFMGWLRREFGTTNTQELLTALIEGDTPLFGERLGELVCSILSYYDTAGKAPERVYHTFVLGLLAHLTYRFTIRSNRESGMGRYDVMLLPKDPRDRGIVMEFKTAESPETIDDALSEALAQMARRQYVKELKDAGVTVTSEIAVAFSGKVVEVRARHQPEATLPNS